MVAVGKLLFSQFQQHEQPTTLFIDGSEYVVALAFLSSGLSGFSHRKYSASTTAFVVQYFGTTTWKSNSM